MLTGRQFRLNRTTLGVDITRPRQPAIEVPAGDIIEVATGPTVKDPRMVEVLWKDRFLLMFTQDIVNRGEEVRGADA